MSISYIKNTIVYKLNKINRMETKMDNVNKTVSENIRQMRKDKDLSFDELAKLSGVSKSMLAQIERGEGNPTLSTLWKIANGMQVPFTALISKPEATYELVRPSECMPIIEKWGGIRNYSIFPDDGDYHFSTYYLEVDPSVSWTSEPHMKGTIEFITVISGIMKVSFEGNLFELKKGDSLRFKADTEHSYHNPGDTVASFLNILYNR